MPTYEGHLAGFDALETVIDATVAAGVRFVSFYTWSTENWNRPKAEVAAIAQALAKSDIAFTALDQKESSLEDIFVGLVEEAEAAA